MTLPSPRIGWCLVGGDPVLLDVAADRYFRLSGLPAQALLDLAKDGETARRECLDAFRARTGLDPDAIGPPCRHSLPSGALATTERRHLAPILLLMSIARLLWTRRILKRRGLARLITRAAPDRLRRSRRTGSDIATLVKAHRSTRRILFSRDACLVRAFSLASQARAHGHQVDIVFGVQLRPFVAHCWVEQQGCLLDDELDHVRCFHPILVL